jgi:hypothetical protein
MKSPPSSFQTAKTLIQFWIGDRRINDWSRRANLFFVLAIGRSGTTFLSRLLSKASGVAVYHEPVREDFWAYRQAFHDESKAYTYFRLFRKRDIFLRGRAARADTYGEVNSLLRRHAIAIQQSFPKAVLLHLIRDGRDVVRSMMARKTMTPIDRNTKGIRPHAEDRWSAEWDKMDRFARLCWYWQVENTYLRKAVGSTVQFEQLLASYDYFRERLLAPCGLELPRSEWQNAVYVPVNATAKHRIGRWEEWSDARKATFLAICGEEMALNGYDL